jgi:hypothetical protein
MKHRTKSSALITILLITLAIGTTQVCRAQAPPDPANLVQVIGTPAGGGAFWSMQLSNFPPAPVPPPGLTLYTDGSGNYFYDDLGVDYATLSAGIWGPPSLSSGRGMAADDVLSPPGNMGGGGLGTNGGQTALPQVISPGPLGPCEIWTNILLAISNRDGNITVTIGNTVAGLSYTLI